MIAKRVFTVALVSSVFFWPGPGFGDEMGQTCILADLEPKPQWSYEASFSPSGEELRVVDINQHLMMTYTLDGRWIESDGLKFLEMVTPGFTLTGAQRYDPRTARSSGADALVLNLGRGHFRTVESGRTTGTYEIGKWRVEPPNGYGNSLQPGIPLSPYSWTFAEGDLIVFTEVGFVEKGGDKDWWAGYLRIPLGKSPEEVGPLPFLVAENEEQKLWLWKTRDQVHIFNRMDFQFLASRGSSAYVLVPREEPGIFVIEKDSKKLKRINFQGLDFGTLPDVSYAHSFRYELPAMMDRVERSSFVVGIYPGPEGLLLLRRQPMGWETEWRLIQAHVERGAVEKTVKLPTRANHVILAVGSPWIGLVEKGPYLSFDQQNIPSAIFIPSRALEASREAQELCREVRRVESLEEVRRLHRSSDLR